MSATEQDTKVAPTREEMVARAVALRPQLVAEQAATEARRYFSPELHEAFLDAGFYDLYVPRRYGGYELDVPHLRAGRARRSRAAACRPAGAWGCR